MPAGMEHKPRQQRAGPAAGRQLRLRSAEPYTQLADHLNLSHDASRWASCGGTQPLCGTGQRKERPKARKFFRPTPLNCDLTVA